MAKQTLPTNFKDDALASSMGGKRRYILTENADGTFSLEDATTYTQVGDVLGAARVNAICKAINESVDQAKVVDNVDDIKAITEPGYVPGTLPLKQVISDLSAMNDNGAIMGMDAREDGVYITYTPPGGADTVRKKLGSGLENIKIRIWGTGGDQDPAGKGRIEGLTSPKIHIKTDSFRSYADINVSVTSASGSTKKLIDIDGQSSSSVWNNETVHDLSGWQNDMPYTLNATCYVVGITVWFED